MIRLTTGNIYLSFKQFWIPFTQWCFVPSLVEIGKVVLEKEINMWKVCNDNDDDKLWSEKLTWALGLGELKLKCLWLQQKRIFLLNRLCIEKCIMVKSSFLTNCLLKAYIIEVSHFRFFILNTFSLRKNGRRFQTY